MPLRRSTSQKAKAGRLPSWRVIGGRNGDLGRLGMPLSVDALFDNAFVCPVCRASSWDREPNGYACRRCRHTAPRDGRFVTLVSEHLSANNEREAAAYDREDASEAQGILDYMLAKPWNYPSITRDRYLNGAAEIAQVGREIGDDGSVLFVFAGGGMEAHVSELLGQNVVLADLSRQMLHLADDRFRHYNVPQPAAYVECDAERLPFKDKSFDLVVGFEGAHHCLVPQAAMHEIWRVAAKRALVVDNLECFLTNALYRFGLSSQIEGTGVKPGRFSKVQLETMIYNANIGRFKFKPNASLPFGIANRVGNHIGRFIERGMNAVGQANMFTLTTYHD